jgi:thioester reductase-like protein
MRHIFLTGGTGVIGSALIPQLLENDDVQLTVLLRAKSEDQFIQRTNDLLAFCDVRQEHSSGRIIFLSGDVCHERFAVTAADYNSLLNTVTHVIHCAGNVRLNQTLHAARQNAIDSVQHVLTFTRGAHKLQKVDVVSTIGVGGRMSGVIPERRLIEQRSFHNNYEQAKAEAEEIIWDAIDAGLPITVHRPSMVVGDSGSGKVRQFQVFYYLLEFLTGRRTWGILPDLGNVEIDIIPVDVVARGIALSSNSSEAAGRVFHLCSGPDRSIKLKDLLELATVALHGRRENMSRLRYISKRHARNLARIASKLTIGHMSRSLSSIPFFLDYLDECQVFQVDRTIDFLAPLGWPLPAPIQYLTQVLDYYLRAKSVEHAAKAV